MDFSDIRISSVATLMHIWLCVFTGTFMTEGPSVGRLSTITGESIDFLHTATMVLAERPIAAAVTRAARSDPWGYFGPLLQVQSDAIELQRADAA